MSNPRTSAPSPSKRLAAPCASSEVGQREAPFSAAGLGLYRTVGFTQIGLRRNYYGRGEDAVIMERRFEGCVVDAAVKERE